MSRPPESARRPLARVLESVAVRKVLEGGSSRLQSVRSHPATQDRVRASFRQLRLLHPTVLNALERRGGLRTDIVRMYRTFRTQTSDRFYDPQDLAEAAAEAVTSGRAHALADLGLIILYLPGRTTPSELKLVQALARQGKCAVILGTTGDDTADQCLNELESSLIACRELPNRIHLPPVSPSGPGPNSRGPHRSRRNPPGPARDHAGSPRKPHAIPPHGRPVPGERALRRPDSLRAHPGQDSRCRPGYPTSSRLRPRQDPYGPSATRRWRIATRRCYGLAHRMSRPTSSQRHPERLGLPVSQGWNCRWFQPVV